MLMKQLLLVAKCGLTMIINISNKIDFFHKTFMHTMYNSEMAAVFFASNSLTLE